MVEVTGLYYKQFQFTIFGVVGNIRDNALASHRCDLGSIHGVGMLDGHVVTKSDRWVSAGHLRHEDHVNAYMGANNNDM